MLERDIMSRKQRLKRRNCHDEAARRSEKSLPQLREQHLVVADVLDHVTTESEIEASRRQVLLAPQQPDACIARGERGTLLFGEMGVDAEEAIGAQPVEQETARVGIAAAPIEDLGDRTRGVASRDLFDRARSRELPRVSSRSVACFEEVQAQLTLAPALGRGPDSTSGVTEAT